MARTLEQTLARALQHARGDGASYQRALVDIRTCGAERRDVFQLVLREGGAVEVPATVWEVAPPDEDDEALAFVVVRAGVRCVLATSADDDDAPLVGAARAIRSCVAVPPPWVIDLGNPVRSVNELLVRDCGWDLTVRPFRAALPYSLHDDRVTLAARVRDALDAVADGEAA